MEKVQNEAKWYAVYTRPRWEKKVAELLTKKKVENYCPLNRVQRQWSDRKKIVQEPLFTSYVFVRIADKIFLPVHQTDGVINFVYWLGKPAVIRDSEITAIKQFLSDYKDVHLEKTKVNVNETVRIIKGPLMAMEGNVIEVLNNTIKVVLPSLGYVMVAHVPKAHIEVINTTTGNQKVTKSLFR
jgi:transcription antitermination factor NusG